MTRAGALLSEAGTRMNRQKDNSARARRTALWLGALALSVFAAFILVQGFAR